jgi:hypothetical protein
MRIVCIICNISYNSEEIAECIKCKNNICQDCVIFEEGNYYCNECINIEYKE